MVFCTIHPKTPRIHVSFIDNFYPPLHNALELLEQFKKTTVIFGVIAIAQTRIEPVEEITSRLKQALEHIDVERLIAAPDCGLAMLDRKIVVAKLRNMVQAAKSVR